MNSSTQVDRAGLHLLAQAAEKHAGELAILDSYSQLSFRELFSRAQQLARSLLGRGLTPGSTLALDNLDPYEIILSFWACSLTGLIAFPLNTRYPEARLHEILSEEGPGLVISGRDLLPGKSVRLQDLLAETIICPQRLTPQIDPQTTVSLLMTSGSSSAPKLVRHSYVNHLINASGSNQNIPLESGDRWLLTLPLYHVGGLAILFRAALAGATVVLPTREQSLLQAISEFSPTHISLVPTQLQRLLDELPDPQGVSSLKAVLLGGSAISQNLIERALDLGLPVYLSYGSTEMASQITTTAKLTHAREPFNSGQVLPGRDVIISHEGEILVKGETLAQGYQQQGELMDLRDGAGWFHTGDVGYLDFQGALTVTGRMDNQFISGGENIQPEHIERALMGHPQVVQALVLPKTDPEFGQRPVAYLQLTANPPTKRELLTHVKNMLPGYMIPRDFLVLPPDLFADRMKVSREDLRGFLGLPNNRLQSLV